MIQQMEDIFGRPYEGFHEARLAGFARNDTLGTIGIAYVISTYTGWKILPTMVGTFAFGEACHLYFGVDTEFIRIVKQWLPAQNYRRKVDGDT